MPKVPTITVLPAGVRPASEGAALVEAEALIDVLRGAGKAPSGVASMLFMALAVVLVDSHSTDAEADAKVGHSEALLRRSLELVRYERRVGRADA